jgi:hypothetical protein
MLTRLYGLAIIFFHQLRNTRAVSKSLWQRYINIIIVFLGIIHYPGQWIMSKNTIFVLEQETSGPRAGLVVVKKKTSLPLPGFK